MNDRIDASSGPTAGKVPLACARGFVVLIALWAAALGALGVLACAPATRAQMVAASPLIALVQTPLSPIALGALAAAMGSLGALLGGGVALLMRRRAIRRFRARAALSARAAIDTRSEERRQRALRVGGKGVEEGEKPEDGPEPAAKDEIEAVEASAPASAVTSAPVKPVEEADAPAPQPDSQIPAESQIAGGESDPLGRAQGPSDGPCAEDRAQDAEKPAMAEAETPAEPSRAILALRSRECDQLSLLQLTERCAVALSRVERATPLSKPARQRFAEGLRQLADHPGLGARRIAEGVGNKARTPQEIPLAQRVHTSELRLQNALRALERLSMRG